MTASLLAAETALSFERHLVEDFAAYRNNSVDVVKWEHSMV